MVQFDTTAFAKQVVRELSTFDWSPRDGLSLPLLRYLDLANAYLKLAGVNIRDERT